MIEDWYEKLRCPRCGKTSMATLVRSKGRKTPEAQSVPKGFKTVKTHKVPTFIARYPGGIALKLSADEFGINTSLSAACLA
jgi:hypothetical protein